MLLDVLVGDVQTSTKVAAEAVEQRCSFGGETSHLLLVGAQSLQVGQQIITRDSTRTSRDTNTKLPRVVDFGDRRSQALRGNSTFSECFCGHLNNSFILRSGR